MPTVTNKDGKKKTFPYTDKGQEDAKKFASQGVDSVGYTVALTSGGPTVKVANKAQKDLARFEKLAAARRKFEARRRTSGPYGSGN